LATLIAGLEERPLSAVPAGVRAILAAALLLQCLLHGLKPSPGARAEILPEPPPAHWMAAASFGETLPASQLAMLYLQAFDNQPGISSPYAALDYDRVEQWLALGLLLDHRGSYPLMMASQLYSQVPLPEKQRRMCDFVHARFLEAPDLRWRWMAHCAIMAKHRLHDPVLALRYANDIAAHAGTASNWARQMRIFILEDLGEIESARILLGGLLANGEVQDPAEIRFLTERLRQLQKPSAAPRTSNSRQP
jgi:hypothetical protein